MSDEQLEALYGWLPVSLYDCEYLALTEQAEKRFPEIHPDDIARAIGRLYGTPF